MFSPLRRIGAQILVVAGVLSTLKGIPWYWALISACVAGMVTIISSTSERVAQLSTLQRYAFYGFAFLLLFALMTAAVKLLPTAVRFVWSTGRPRTETEQLKHDCLQLGRRLSKLTKQRFAEYRKVDEREPTTDQQRMAQGWKMSVILERARGEYKKNFRDKAMKLFELAEARGLVEPHWRRFAYNAGGDLRRMQMVAERLIRIGRVA